MKLPLRPLSVSIVVPLLLAGICACSMAAAGTAAGAPAVANPTRADASLQAFAKEIGVTCESREGQLACIGGKPEVGDYSDVELHPDCGAGGLFGVIDARQPVELRNRISPLDTRTIATLMPGQTVCIRAIGQVEGKPFYYFATAIPKALAPACLGTAACAPITPPTIHWISKRPVATCHTDTQGSLRNCASGWIQADELSRIPSGSQSR